MHPSLVLALCLAFLAGEVAEGRPRATTTFYITPKGDDSQGKGTEASPWASVSRAQQAVRELRNGTAHLPGPVNVMLGPGLYTISKPITISSEDSGEEGKMVTFKASDDQQVSGPGEIMLGEIMHGEIMHGEIMLVSGPGEIMLDALI